MCTHQCKGPQKEQSKGVLFKEGLIRRCPVQGGAYSEVSYNRGLLYAHVLYMIFQIMTHSTTYSVVFECAHMYVCTVQNK